MTKTAMRSRQRKTLDELASMAAPGFGVWQLVEPTCPTGKRRWPTAHAAATALRNARDLRVKRARGHHRGSLEVRFYECARCSGFHLTSMAEPPTDSPATDR